MYRCPLCKKQFETVAEFKRHFAANPQCKDRAFHIAICEAIDLDKMQEIGLLFGGGK